MMLFKVSLLSTVVVLGHFAHASENVTPFNEGARLASLFSPGAESFLADISLAAAASCDVGKKACNNKCIPFSGNCCLQGGYCESGNYCIATGCCPIGRTCSGSVRECASGKVDCNDGCMPAGAVCCSGGGYCDAGEVCSQNETCRKPGSSGQCNPGRVVCGTGCMPAGSVCCANGRYCDAGATCQPDGCCPFGKRDVQPTVEDCFSCFANNDVAQGSASPDADAGFDDDFVYNFIENVVHDIVHVDSDPSRWCDPDAHQYAGNRSVRRDANTGNPGVGNSDPV